MACGKFSKSASQGWKHLKSPQNPSGGGVGAGLQAGQPGEGSRDPRFGLYRRGHGDSSARKRRQTPRQMRLRQPRPPRCPSVGTQTNGHGQTDRPFPGHTPCQPGSPPKTRHSHQIAPFAAPASPPPALCHQQRLACCINKAGLSKARQPGRIVQQQQLRSQ